MDYSIVIETRDGQTFKSGEMLDCPAPGTPEDQQANKLFSEVAAKLRR